MGSIAFIIITIFTIICTSLATEVKEASFRAAKGTSIHTDQAEAFTTKSISKCASLCSHKCVCLRFAIYRLANSQVECLLETSSRGSVVALKPGWSVYESTSIILRTADNTVATSTAQSTIPSTATTQVSSLTSSDEELTTTTGQHKPSETSTTSLTAAAKSGGECLLLFSITLYLWLCLFVVCLYEVMMQWTVNLQLGNCSQWVFQYLFVWMFHGFEQHIAMRFPLLLFQVSIGYPQFWPEQLLDTVDQYLMFTSPIDISWILPLLISFPPKENSIPDRCVPHDVYYWLLGCKIEGVPMAELTVFYYITGKAIRVVDLFNKVFWDTVLAFNSCTIYVGSQDIIHDRTPDCDPIS